jgi:hypothetical protein
LTKRDKPARVITLDRARGPIVTHAPGGRITVSFSRAELARAIAADDAEDDQSQTRQT